MNNLERRIERLEERLGVKQGPRYVLITNLNPDGEEDPYTRELFPGLWAIGYGGPFTEDEIRNLREEHKAEYESRRREESDGVPSDA
jgi:hypothetical protein